MPWPWCIIGLAVVMIGIAKSGFGSGLGLIVVPITAIALGYTSLGSEAALGLLLPLLMVGDVIAVTQYRREFSFPAIRRLLPWSLLGIILGWAVLIALKHLGDNSQILLAMLIRLEIGLESIVLVSLTWWRSYRGRPQKLMPEPARSIATGTFAGFSSTLAHAAGPVVAMYVLPLKLDRRIFVGTTAMFFFIVNGLKVPFYLQAGLFQQTPWQAVAMLMPLVVLGSLSGRWMVRRMSDRVFTQLVLVSVFVLGIYLVGDAAWRLAR